MHAGGAVGDGEKGNGTFPRKLGHVCMCADFEMNMHGHGQGGGARGEKLLAKVNLKVFMRYCRRVRLGDMYKHIHMYICRLCRYEWSAHF